jgi:GNAT superfamily N-acetyltransferase
MTPEQTDEGMRAGKPRLAIRPARMADVPVVHELAERSATELLSRHYTPSQLAAAARTGFYRVETELIFDGTYYVLEVDSQIAACSGWSDHGTFYPPGASGSHGHQVDADIATMRATYVDPRWARRGLATLLARFTETAATIAGFQRFEALCSPLSEAMRLRLGYRLVERVTVPLLGDITVMAALMRKAVAEVPTVGAAGEATPGPLLSSCGCQTR